MTSYQIEQTNGNKKKNYFLLLSFESAYRFLDLFTQNIRHTEVNNRMTLRVLHCLSCVSHLRTCQEKNEHRTVGRRGQSEGCITSQRKLTSKDSHPLILFRKPLEVVLSYFICFESLLFFSSFKMFHTKISYIFLFINLYLKKKYLQCFMMLIKLIDA